MVIRQAHPGPKARPYESFDDKLNDAVAYVLEERIPWPVAVDDLEGTVHQVYGGLSDPSYLIDADGNVAFYNMWTSAPVLHRAIEELLERGGRGVVAGGLDRRPHMMAAMTDGWRALRRGLPQSAVDMMVAAPGSPIGLWLGDKLKPVLRPLTLRARPLSRGWGLLLAAGAAAGLVLGARAISRRRAPGRRRPRELPSRAR